MMRALGPLALLLSGCNVVIGLDELTPPVAPATRVTLARAFGSARQQAITAVAVDADGFLVVAGHNDGSFSLGGEDLVNADGRDLFVAKLDRDGNHVWSVPFEATGTSYASDLALGQSEEIVVAGYFGGTLGIADPPFVSDGRDAFVLKLRSDGEVLTWTGRSKRRRIRSRSIRPSTSSWPATSPGRFTTATKRRLPWVGRMASSSSSTRTGGICGFSTSAAGPSGNRSAPWRRTAPTS
jgi:hypothetical protein